MVGADLAPRVSTTDPYVVPAVGETRYRIAALDLGIKTATPRHLAALGVETHVLPATATADDLLELGTDGVFLSNGPGDPAAADYAVETVRGVLEARRPLFGICFGNQILGRALGLGTYKLRFGHRGLNQPVLDRVSGTVRVTSHNHGFAVDAPLDRPTDTPHGPVEVSHVGLNDDVVEGLRLLEAPAFSVQFHPESAAGPHDAAPLFQRFVDLMEATRNGGPAVSPVTTVEHSTGEQHSAQAD
jgi:carbamoyl-phosphate synthase small subunit